MPSSSISTSTHSSSNQPPASHKSPSGHIDVYVVDDHPAVQEALQGALNEEMDLNICGTSTSVAKALHDIKQLDPDVVVVDLLLKGGHGLDFVEKVGDRCPETKSIVYSMYDERIYAERAVRAGASGYLMKNESTDHLVQAIRRVASGELYLSHQMTSIVLGNYAVAQASEPSFPIDELTEAEMEVFRRLGLGHSLETIQNELGLARKTIETYRRRAKEKLELDSVDQLLQHAVLWALRDREETSAPAPSSSENGRSPDPSESELGLSSTASSRASDEQERLVVQS